MDNDILLRTFMLHPDCPPNNKKFFNEKKIKLKTNIFQETKMKGDQTF